MEKKISLVLKAVFLKLKIFKTYVNWIETSLHYYSRVGVAFCYNLFLFFFYSLLAFNHTLASATLRLYPWYKYQPEVSNKWMFKNREFMIINNVWPARTQIAFQIRRRFSAGLWSPASYGKYYIDLHCPLCTSTTHFYYLGPPRIIQESTWNVWKTCATITKPWTNTRVWSPYYYRVWGT